MAFLDRRAGIACGSEPLREKIGKKPAELWLALAPGHIAAAAIVDEVFRSELEVHPPAVRSDHDSAELIDHLRLAIRRESHHLVLVAVAIEAEILGKRRVVNPERMRKGHHPPRLDSAAPPDAPHRARKVAQAV